VRERDPAVPKSALEVNTQQRAYNQRKLWVLLAGASTLVFAFSRLVPCTPPIRYGEIEDSYIQFLHAAFAERLQFGRDVFFTFGPWGFLYGGYYPPTHLLAVVSWVCLSVVFWWTGWKVARHLSRNNLLAWSWLLAFTAVAGLPVFAMTDTRLKAFLVLFWLLHFFVEDRPLSFAQAVVAAVLGLLSLVKLNVLLDCALILVIVSLDIVVRQRQFPWLLPLFAGSILLFWLAAGQSLATLAPYLRSVASFMGAYGEAATITGPKEAQDVCWFLLASGLVCLTVGYAVWGRRKSFVLLSMTGLGVILFTTFKHGYVRHDFHDASATLELLLVSLASLVVVWPVTRSRHRWLSLASLLPTVLVFVLAALTFGRYQKESLLASLLQTLNGRSLWAPAKLVFGTANLPQGYETYLADIRKDSPLPRIDGTVDTLPGNAAAIMAHRLPYRPRPVMQSLVAYTRELEELNASFFRSPRAPANVFFQMAPVDDHFPALEDGRSWPDLLTCYDVQEIQWPFTLLKRSIAPRHWRLAPLADTPVRFGDLVQVPSASNGPIWAVFNIDQTVWGRTISMLYKPPILFLTVFTADGRRASYRLVPGMARAGFLLSPLIEGPASFGFLAASNGLSHLAGRELTSLVLSAKTQSGATACYQSPMDVKFYRLDYPRQDLSGLNGLPELRSLLRAIGRATWLRGDYRAELFYAPSCGSVLQVAPNSAFQLSVPGRPKRLKLGFGILWRGHAALNQTAGVVFRVSALDSHGDLVPLWAHRLDGVEGNADQNKDEAEVELSQVPSSEIILETVRATPEANDRLACYWSEIDLE
jgi:hypothetical protein